MNTSIHVVLIPTSYGVLSKPIGGGLNAGDERPRPVHNNRRCRIWSHSTRQAPHLPLEPHQRAAAITGTQHSPPTDHRYYRTPNPPVTSRVRDSPRIGLAAPIVTSGVGSPDTASWAGVNFTTV